MNNSSIYLASKRLITDKYYSVLLHFLFDFELTKKRKKNNNNNIITKMCMIELVMKKEKAN